MSVIEYSIKNKSKQLEFYREVCDKLDKENKQLRAMLDIGKTCGFCPYYKDLEENKQLKEQLQQSEEVIEKVKRMLEINIEITKEQPSGNKLEDKFILDRYNDLLDILNEYKKEESK